MKKTITILVFITFFSCSLEKEQNNNEITIPLIEKNTLDANFKLVNGILLFDSIPYSGIVNEMYSKGGIKTKSEYFNGRREGVFIGWYSNGNKWFNREYKRGLKVGVHLGWYENKKRMYEYHFDNNGNYNGSVKEWYVNGNLASSFNYLKGKEDGSQRMWQIDGKVKSNFVTRKGERFGLIGLKKCYSVNTKNEEF